MAASDAEKQPQDQAVVVPPHVSTHAQADMGPS